MKFANVTSMLALFVALGGTSYAAINLPANSVGKSEIRHDGVGKSEVRASAIGASELRGSSVNRSEIATNAVGSYEIRPSAIDSDELADGGIQAVDLSEAARTALTEASAVSFRAAVTTAGTAAGGNAKSVSRAAPGSGIYTVELARDVSACQFAATLAGVKSGTTTEAPVQGLITAEPAAEATKVTVKTYAGSPAAAADAPFHLLVAC